MTKLTPRERIVLAAVFGGTNMGMTAPTQAKVQSLIAGEREQDLDSAVYALWSGYMEDDQIERAFLAEAKHWLRHEFKSSTTREHVIDIWPHTAKLFWEEENVT